MGSDYRERFAEAMRLSGMDEHALAREVGITYQAVKKVLLGTSKMLKAHHNVMAARAMHVDSEWLATGDGIARGARVWPFTQELLAACRRLDPPALRQAENAARNVLDMDPLPKGGDISVKAA